MRICVGLDTSLRALLTPFEPETLRDDPSTVYALDVELRLAYVNPAWHRFARENGAAWADDERGPWSIGASVMDAVPTVLRPFYDALFEEVRRGREPYEHSYECSSPITKRMFQMRVLPCGKDGVLVVNSLVHEIRYPGALSHAIEALYREVHGLIVICANCRRVRRAHASPAVWDWVPAYVERIPDQVSHGLCEICSHFYYFPQ